MSSPVVTIEQGQLEGTVKTNLDGEQFYAFQGIPFAEPPLGSLRFKPPIKAKKWNGVLKATKDGQQCYSINPMVPSTFIGGEDCLFLNVFTKNVDNKALKPVMFYIHGGAYVMGSNGVELYGPEHLLLEDIVLVVTNYRLGLLGFLSIEDSKLNIANAGMHDMILALQWTQQNITAFGGDPSNVTIFGESAGGSAVHSLYLSPLCRGLFHKAIAQSGCALNEWAVSKSPAKRLAKILKIENASNFELLKVLQGKSVEELFLLQHHLKNDLIDNQFFAPTVDSYAERPFWPKQPIEIVKSGEIPKDVPFMAGYCSAEGMLFDWGLLKLEMEMTDAELTILPGILGYVDGTVEYQNAKKKILDFYVGQAANLKLAKYDYLTDLYFLVGLVQTVYHQHNYSKAPTYFYRFGLETELNFYKQIVKVTEKGTCHADELGYLFKNSFLPSVSTDSVAGVAIRRFVKLWTNFAKIGDPTPQFQGDKWLNVNWKPVTSKNVEFLNFEEQLGMAIKPENARIEFWKGLLKNSPANIDF